MNNTSVSNSLNDCLEELKNIQNIIDSMGSTARFVPYLNKYSIIKACGTIERAYKDIISDVCIVGATSQTNKYIEKTFRESSSNPSLHNIENSLKKFDDNWHSQFLNDLNSDADSSQLKSSLKSLVQLRNNLAHGGNPSSSVDDVIEYFNNSHKIMIILDNIVG